MDIFFETPEGWDCLINQLLADIEPHKPKNFKFVQIKEKFGGLRVYTQNSSLEIEDIIQDYEHISYYVCSKCGKPAQLQTTGYILPYCKECVPKNEKTVKIEFKPQHKVSVFTKNKQEEITRDTSDIWKRYKARLAAKSIKED